MGEKDLGDGGLIITGKSKAPKQGPMEEEDIAAAAEKRKVFTEAPELTASDVEIKFSVAMMKAADEIFAHRRSIMTPRDPRMRIKESSLWNWILKFAGIISSPFTHPNTMVKYASFREFWSLVKVQSLNKSEWKAFGDDITELTKDVLKAADTVVCTPMQLESKVISGIKFAMGIIDEATTGNEAESTLVRLVCEHVFFIGDKFQPHTTILSRIEQNSFRQQSQTSPFS